ncbi:aminotransferase class V-fold PLP-dependent enzyme, partial [bacterium]
RTAGIFSGGMILHGKADRIRHTNWKELLSRRSTSESYWELVRNMFLLPEDYAYLNTGGLGAVPAMALERVKSDLTALGIYPKPGHDEKTWWEVKEKCAGLLHCKKEELALTGSATEGINIILQGLPLKKGDEIITSTHEHPALNIPLLNKMQKDGIVLKTFEPNRKDGLDNVSRIQALMTRRTRLLFISHITCTTGQLFPVSEISRLAKEKAVWIALDGAQCTGNIPVDVKKYGVDFYAASGHKWMLGPKRTGVLYVAGGVMEVLRPGTVGAYSDDGHDIVKKHLRFQPTAQRYEYATQNETLFHGLGVSLDLIRIIGIDKIWTRNREMAEMFYRGLKKMDRIRILSPEQELYRTSLITFKAAGIHYRDLASHLMKKRFRVRVVPEANLEGIRVSFHLYNNEKEVQRLLAEIQNVLSL